MKCAACSSRMRTSRRALVLTGPGKLKPGRVCNACASAGWLLVLGDDRPVRRKVAARRERVALAAELFERAQATALAQHVSSLGRETREYKPGMFRKDRKP